MYVGKYKLVLWTEDVKCERVSYCDGKSLELEPLESAVAAVENQELGA